MATWYADFSDLSAFNYLSSIVLPTMTADRSFEQTAKVNTQLDLFRLRLLLDLYKQEHGAYPKTLDPLADDLGGAIPVAPLTGNPYVYTPHEDYYVVSQP
jgi:hypothetical protein